MDSVDVLFFHPAIRNYRVALFGYLNKRYNTHFFFTDARGGWDNLKEFSHLGPEVDNSLAKAEIKNYTSIYKKKYTPSLVYKLSKALIAIFTKNPRVVILTNFISPFSVVVYLLCRILGKQVIFYDLNWIYPIRLFLGRLYLPIFRFLVKKQEFIITAGKTHKAFLVKYGAVDTSIYIAPTVSEPPPEDRIALNQRALQIKINMGLKDKKIILYMGRMVNYKAPDLLIKAFLEYTKNNAGSNTALVMCGTGPLLKDCKRLIANYEIEDVHILGEVQSSERWEYFTMADIYILPSLFRYDEPVYCEGWGLGVNEALSIGIPVIGTIACGGVHEIIGHLQEGGLMIGEDNVSELATAIECLIGDDEYREKLAHSGKVKLESFVNGEIQRKAFATVIDAALHQKII